ncbi:hypothetical protein HanPSC8_Chr17g0771661 [Helianthus annuus]|nr:hypothetical protein HanPSC8_Chr17g0771661 [Helianthus annuus]
MPSINSCHRNLCPVSRHFCYIRIVLSIPILHTQHSLLFIFLLFVSALINGEHEWNDVCNFRCQYGSSSPTIKTSAIDQLIDPVLESNSNPEIKNMITSVAELAFRCLQFDSVMRPTMNEVLHALMEIQDGKGIEDGGNIRDLETTNLPPLSEISDSVVLLKDFPPSPLSISSEWQSDNSVSTTVSSNGDRLPVKNRTSR